MKAIIYDSVGQYLHSQGNKEAGVYNTVLDGLDKLPEAIGSSILIRHTGGTLIIPNTYIIEIEG
jgi:hypothetical protein